ncbi:MAG: YceH family protein [Burkholderiales bacterium]|nr:MAG: YceH family protein [Burkholderiales bacterium]
MDRRPPPLLSPLEARVVAVLYEKRRTVPDTYPLTLNALVAGCNQKSSREPVMNVTAADVQAAIDRLMRLSLVIESSGGRVMRYSENIKAVLQVPSESVALLAVLILRGPQTAGELRIHCERMQRFSDISAVQGFLNELAEWPAGAMVVELPRQPGARETRWAHLLSGPVAPGGAAAAAGTVAASAAPVASAAVSPVGVPDEGESGVDRATAAELDALKARVSRLEDQLSSLARTVTRLCDELGVDLDQG